MTVDTQVLERVDEGNIQFTDEQQRFLDKKIGQARTKARDKAVAAAKTQQEAAAQEAELEKLAASAKWKELAEHHEARVKELEPYEAEAAAYKKLIAGMLKDRLETLGEAAKTAVDALPLTDLEKMNWLDKNQELFAAGAKVGTPAKRKKAPQPLTDKGREGHRPMRL